VVALVPHVRVVGAVPVWLRDRVLCHEAGHHRRHVDGAVLWVHADGLVGACVVGGAVEEGARVLVNARARALRGSSLGCCRCARQLTSSWAVRAFRPQPPFPSQVFFLLTGSIGFVATLYFVSKIFGTIKVD
jgi:hypothetical protein